MGKRAKGEGSIFQRKSDGRWVGRISLGRDDKGRRIQKTVYGGTQGEVVDKIDNLKQQAKLNSKSVVSKDSVAAYLQNWLYDDVAVNRAGKTFEEYELASRLYIVPFIGAIKLNRLDAEALQKWQATLKRKSFSDNQRLRSIRTLRNALNKAVKLRKIPFNPCIALDKPRVERKEVIPLEREQCQTLFAECKSHRIGDIITLAAMTGLRKRELFALEWSAVNLSEGVLTVRKALEEIGGKITVKVPKTRTSRRVVTLEPIAINALASRMEKAVAEGFTPDEVPICFPDTLGGYLRGSNFDRNVWHPIRKSAGIPKTFKFHDLRHTQASLMLYAGVDLKVIQHRLGHASFATTANLYAHLMQDSQARATEKLSELMGQSRASEYIH
ncbi:tyrosine-type recombinase/integrase [Fuerstiella marisgermanici]|uniref:Tyrosine recombinase XerD n=1 Tax=Fuerstiella marisgermanici TaxID=1891926 RepID=A0A1P8WS89_9PLAN|nr:site-specific integrase [Fuerstiella marisgermanici]APZ96927.1 Tyrosine recombinase XerD [Fuerstiella marisgermanici]